MADIVKIPKVQSHVEGLDEALDGGFPKGRTTMVSGPAGSGKTVLGTQFIYHGSLQNEPGMIVSFEERDEAIRQNARSLGWDFEALEKENKLSVVSPTVEYKAVVAGPFTLTGTIALLEAEYQRIGAERIMVDGIDVLMRLLPDQDSQRNELMRLHNWFYDHKATAIINSKMRPDMPSTPEYSFLEYTADCVIRLTVDNEDPQPTRRLQIVKYRGSGFNRSGFPFTIVPRFGVTVNPVSLFRAGEHPLGPRISAGHQDLDTFLGGGYRQGAAVLLAGPTGAGKTILASKFTEQACKRGEKVLYVSFEESCSQIVSAVASVNIDLQSSLDKGLLKLITYLPETAGLETHLYHHVQVLREFQPDHLIVDSITPISRMASRRSVFEYTLRLVALCRQMGTTCVLTRQIPSFNVEYALKDVDFVSQLDTVIFLNYAEIGGEVNRTLLVLKTRGSSHSNQFREYIISGSGISFRDVYAASGGMLTGAAREEQEFREQADDIRRHQRLREKEREIERLRDLSRLKEESLGARIQQIEMEADLLRKENDALGVTRAKRKQMRESSYSPRRNKGGDR